MSDSIPRDPTFSLSVERSEASCWRDLAALHGPGRRLEQATVGGALLILDHAREAPLSRVLLLGLEEAASPETIDEIIATYQKAGISSFELRLSPVARPTTLRRTLLTKGFTQGNNDLILARPTDDAQEPDPYFRFGAADLDDLKTVASIIATAGGLPADSATLLASTLHLENMHLYLALDGATAYAVGALYVYGTVAWAAPAWTMPAYRNRGTHSALLAYTLRRASERGCDWVTTRNPATREARTRNLERNGFQLVYVRHHLIWNAPSA